MQEIHQKDFLHFLKTYDKVIFRDRLGSKEKVIKIGIRHKIKNFKSEEEALAWLKEGE